MSGGGGNAPSQTEEERAAAERGAREFNQAVDILTPTADALTKRFKETAADSERVGSEASLAAAEAFGGTDLMKGAAAKGVAPTSGRAVTAASDMGEATSSAVSQGVAAGEQEVDSKSVRGKMRLAKAGRGIADESSRLLTNIGKRKTQEEIAQQKRDLMREAAVVESVGAIGGAAAGAMNNGGNGGLMEGATDDLQGAWDETEELDGKLDSNSWGWG